MVKSGRQDFSWFHCHGRTIFVLYQSNQTICVSVLILDRSFHRSTLELQLELMLRSMVASLAPDELMDAAKPFIKKLSMKKGFHPDNYENPSTTVVIMSCAMARRI